MNKQSKKYYEELEKLMVSAVGSAKPYLSHQDFCDINDYIEQGEYGVGWELLWHLVSVKEKGVSANLIICGKKMGFNTEDATL